MEEKEQIITVHVSKDVQPETLQALGEMLKCLIEQIEQGGITIRGVDWGKPGSEKTIVAKFEDGELVSEREILPRH